MVDFASEKLTHERPFFLNTVFQYFFFAASEMFT